MHDLMRITATNTALDGFIQSWDTVLAGLARVALPEDLYQTFMSCLRKIFEFRRPCAHLIESIDEGEVKDAYDYCHKRATAMLDRHTTEINRTDLLDSLSRRPTAATYVSRSVSPALRAAAAAHQTVSPSLAVLSH